ncbi:putative pyridoxal 5'-phosphate synthase subunit PDX2 [Cyphellophora attinorum]|uniref:glutaminase n=1 Tax=Cyphellophora attinorum TaxID=1664694 RepID=A0A0N1HQ52_9EURO|nr:putative pyridoxal 5'-phosphate synthase subunit PDX2 [Phialophora attinorum]KPI40014.1 putative pyridoxal 5'-phosphate synthase subunit PDX2 [Phialophora attinorum]
MTVTVGVLALQGAFLEHLVLLRNAAVRLNEKQGSFNFIEVRNKEDLSQCDALIIPGGESTTISLVAAQSDLLEPLRQFVKVDRRPTWGTCAGLILLAEAANATKKGGQELIGGLDVRVNRNHFGRQIESFQADLNLQFLDDKFPGIFIRAPIVEKILPNISGSQESEQRLADTVVAPSRTAKDDAARAAMGSEVEVLGTLPGRLRKAAKQGAEVNAEDDVGDIIAVRQGNVFGTSFHPELTADTRIHQWWLREVQAALQRRSV